MSLRTDLFTATSHEGIFSSQIYFWNEPTGTLRLGAKITKVEQAVFLPEVNFKFAIAVLMCNELNNLQYLCETDQM